MVLDVAAPATVITALLVYIGWIRNQAYYGYFGGRSRGTQRTAHLVE